MNPDAADLGLRERKRLATRRAIQAAAISLAQDKGTDRVTVDEISRIADISPRTFFNYFPSKEAALIGDTPTLPPGPQLEHFVNAGPGADILSGLGDLISGSVDDVGDPELNKARLALLKGNQQLFSIRMTAMREFEEQLRQLVAARLSLDDAGYAANQDALLSRSRLITQVAFAAIRHAWAYWADDGGSVALKDRLRNSFEELREVLQ
ncbi:MAG: TetR family transcriptional regulator, partial [Microbacteriaceae bacterium]|nr:TetR family transcriptional regulator [Microbacteriaceae bacterium]